MTLDKAIKHGKEKRRPYRGSARFDWHCRNHGSCGYCRDNRLFNSLKIKEKSEDDFASYHRDDYCTEQREDGRDWEDSSEPPSSLPRESGVD